MGGGWGHGNLSTGPIHNGLTRLVRGVWLSELCPRAFLKLPLGPWGGSPFPTCLPASRGSPDGCSCLRSGRVRHQVSELQDPQTPLCSFTSVAWKWHGPRGPLGVTSASSTPLPQEMLSCAFCPLSAHLLQPDGDHPPSQLHSLSGKIPCLLRQTLPFRSVLHK